MARNMNANNINSSPPSRGTATHHGTPSTIPTMMSPDGGNSQFSQAITVTGGKAVGTLAAQRGQTITPLDLNDANHTRLHPNLPALAPSEGRFTVDDDSVRGFIAVGLTPATPGLCETIANAYQHFPSLINVDASHLMSNGSFSVEFYNYQDAVHALRLTVQNLFHGQNIQCFKLFPKDLAVMRGLNPGTVSNHVAEYLLSVIDVGAPVADFDLRAIFAVCQSGVGAAPAAVKALQHMARLPGAVATFRVEWLDSRVNALLLSGAEFLGYRLTIMPFTPDVDVGPVQLANRGRGRAAHFNAVESFLAPRVPRSPAAGAHNVVDLVKIKQGQDVRTTIMLRNIPNRVDQAGLKSMLDETSRGQYDFMYLRIDFANNCNVGYAFINFTDPAAIVTFAEARAGQRWNIYQSDKVAEISYATIQGLDCLIQKFRNSSVMLEQSAFRPKLYRTGNGPAAGTEMAFPLTDNLAKLKRSCDNAEHVGLYAPREGQAYRERQRRQGSQYDRGTPGAEFERHYAIAEGRARSVRNNNFYTGAVGAAFRRLGHN